MSTRLLALAGGLHAACLDVVRKSKKKRIRRQCATQNIVHELVPIRSNNVSPNGTGDGFISLWLKHDADLLLRKHWQPRLNLPQIMLKTRERAAAALPPPRTSGNDAFQLAQWEL